MAVERDLSAENVPIILRMNRFLDHLCWDKIGKQNHEFGKLTTLESRNFINERFSLQTREVRPEIKLGCNCLDIEVL